MKEWRVYQRHWNWPNSIKLYSFFNVEKNAFSDENTERYKNQVVEERHCAPFDDTSKEDVFTSSNKKVANVMQILHSG